MRRGCLNTRCNRRVHAGKGAASSRGAERTLRSLTTRASSSAVESDRSTSRLKASPSRVSTSTSLTARTVALRGREVSSPTSPKEAPGPNVPTYTSRSATRATASASPDVTTKKRSAGSPSATITSPRRYRLRPHPPGQLNQQRRRRPRKSPHQPFVATMHSVEPATQAADAERTPVRPHRTTTPRIIDRIVPPIHQCSRKPDRPTRPETLHSETRRDPHDRELTEPIGTTHRPPTRDARNVRFHDPRSARLACGRARLRSIERPSGALPSKTSPSS